MMLAQVVTPDVDVEILLPLIIMAVGGLLILTFTSVTKSVPAWFVTGWSVAASLAAAIASVPLGLRDTGDGIDAGPTATAGGGVGFDGFSLFLTVVIALGVAMASLLAHDYLRREELEGPELHVLLLIAGCN